MKKVLVVLLVAGMILGVGSVACQKTPESPIVVGKNTELLIEKGQPDNENSIRFFTLATPERFITETQDSTGRIHIKANAPIEVPAAEKIPIAKVEKAAFTQEQANKLIEILTGGEFFEMPEEETKQDLERILTKLYAMQAGTDPADPDIDDPAYWIDYYEGLLPSATDEKNLPLAHTKFQQNVDGMYDEAIKGFVKINGESGFLEIVNDMDWQNHVLYKRFDEQMAYAFEPLHDELEYAPLSISPEQAQLIANQLISALGIEYLKIDSIVEASSAESFDTAQNTQLPKVYKLQYVRDVSGVLIAYSDNYGNASENDSYQAPWEYERMTFLISDAGIYQFEWYSPYTTPEIIVKDAELLEFNEIAAIFDKMITIKNVWMLEEDSGNYWDIAITKVRFGLMRIKDRSNEGAGLLIPVWDFMGNTCKKNSETGDTLSGVQMTEQHILTINAIDGSIIDRGLGY